MKIIKSSVSILPQGPGVIGLKKHIEKLGRIAYLSEDKITDDSYIKFNNMLYNRGHWAVFNSGTVYMNVPLDDKDFIKKLEQDKIRPYVKSEKVGGYLYVTTNYRVICKLKEEEKMEKYWCEPTEDHYHRVTTIWTCSRGIQTELVRHRIMSFIAESTRYCGYSKGRFGGELTYIFPEWIYRVQAEIGNTIDPLTGKSRDYLFSIDGEDLIRKLSCFDRTVASRYNTWKAIEDEYIYETNTDEGIKLRPEEARGILCNDLKSIVGMTGFVEDFITKPEDNTPEKEGFFYLRCAEDAHLDMQVLARDLKNQFILYGLNKLK